MYHISYVDPSEKVREKEFTDHSEAYAALEAIRHLRLPAAFQEDEDGAVEFCSTTEENFVELIMAYNGRRIYCSDDYPLTHSIATNFVYNCNEKLSDSTRDVFRLNGKLYEYRPGCDKTDEFQELDSTYITWFVPRGHCLLNS